MRGVSPARTISPPPAARPLSLLVTLEHQDIEAIAINAETARDVSGMRITRDLLTSAERRDLANLLLPAAWSAVLERPASCCSTASWKPTTRCPPTADDPTSRHTHRGEIVGRPPPGLQLVRRALRGHRSRRPLARRVRTMPGGWNAMNDRRDGPRWP
jgi:hypothetical protein